MTHDPEDQALSACLDARDAQFAATRLVEKCSFFRQDILDALYKSESATTTAIHILLEMRRSEAYEVRARIRERNLVGAWGRA